MILENPLREGVSTIIMQLDEDNRWHISTHQIKELFKIDSIENKYIIVNHRASLIDGLHRSVCLLVNGINEVPAAVVGL